MNILIAEDDPVNRRLLRKTLQNWGHHVVEARDGLQAWTAFQQGGFRMVITDWMMPGLSGPELCRRIRLNETRDDIQSYIILLTARGSIQDLAAGFEAGVDDFISKPFEPDELRARLNAGKRIVGLQEELVAARHKMEQLALTDGLTGLLNRRALMDALRRDEDRMRRAQEPIAVVMTDVDHFKRFNDRYGHQTGDQVLCLVADCLQASVRTGDQVGRWGGEEFLLILPGADVLQASEVAERCRELIANQVLEDPEHGEIRVSSSFGVASTEGADREDIMSLVQQADQALYWAKEAGRNCVKIYTPGPERHAAR